MDCMEDNLGENPLETTECRTVFKSSSSLIKQIRVHTEGKPHQCLMCLNDFKENSHELEPSEDRVEKKLEVTSVFIVLREVFRKD